MGALTKFLERNDVAVIVEAKHVSKEDMYSPEANREEGRRLAEIVFGNETLHGFEPVVKINTVGDPRDGRGHIIKEMRGVATNFLALLGILEGIAQVAETGYVVDGVNEDQGNTFSKWGVYDMIEGLRKDLPKWKLRDLTWPGNYGCFNVVEVNGVVHPKIPLCRPVGDKNTFYLRISAPKAHNLPGISVNIKNSQGTIMNDVRHFCEIIGPTPEEFLERILKSPWAEYYRTGKKDNLITSVRELHERHVKEGFPFWHMAQEKQPYRLEMWCQRIYDLTAALNQVYGDNMLNIILGPIGRDGSGFNNGKDVYFPYHIVSKDALLGDWVLAVMSGHEDAGFLRVGYERGMGKKPEEAELYLYDKEEGLRQISVGELKSKRVLLGVCPFFGSDDDKSLRVFHSNEFIDKQLREHPEYRWIE